VADRLPDRPSARLPGSLVGILWAGDGQWRRQIVVPPRLNPGDQVDR